MSETSDDAERVRRAQRGDRGAFEALVLATSRLVFSRLYLDTGDTHRAEDLTQETFLTAWKSIGQVNDPSGFRPWLLSVAKTVAIDAARHEGRRKRSGPRSSVELAASLPARGAGPADSAEQEESRQRVLDVLRSLPEEYRLPLTLRYIAGADYDTISQQLGLSNGSLRGLLNRGMSKLRQQMNLTSSTRPHS